MARDEDHPIAHAVVVEALRQRQAVGALHLDIQKKEIRLHRACFVASRRDSPSDAKLVL